MLDDYTRANLALWNEWTDIHERSPLYDVEGFKAGRTALHRLEIDELGDVRGRTLLHLQCHFGLDTLSWARLGATVTGVDFSVKAIALARSLADELAIPATFHCTPLDDVERVLEGSFDIVFTSYGAIEWLADLDRWAAVIARYLKPGGTFSMAEIHPLAQMLDEMPGRHDVWFTERYFPTGEPERCRVEGSYADPDAVVEHDVCYGWPHSFAEIINALIGVGLRVEYLHEFPFAVCPFWRWMVREQDGWYYLPGGRRDVPFTYSIKATMPVTRGA